MTRSITRRSVIALGAGLGGVAVFGPANAAILAMPTEKRILTISGKIANTNDGDAAMFDRPMLEAIGMSAIETATPWYNGTVRFEGVRMDALMQHVGATGESVTATALNDFSTDIPISDFSRFGVILALKRDGIYMPVRDKGPLFIIYPYDNSSELRSQKYYSRSAWQVSRLVLT